MREAANVPKLEHPAWMLPSWRTCLHGNLKLRNAAVEMATREMTALEWPQRSERSRIIVAMTLSESKAQVCWHCAGLERDPGPQYPDVAKRRPGKIYLAHYFAEETHLMARPSSYFGVSSQNWHMSFRKR